MNEAAAPWPRILEAEQPRMRRDADPDSSRGPWYFPEARSSPRLDQKPGRNSGSGGSKIRGDSQPVRTGLTPRTARDAARTEIVLVEHVSDIQRKRHRTLVD